MDTIVEPKVAVAVWPDTWRQEDEIGAPSVGPFVATRTGLVVTGQPEYDE